MIMVWLAGLIRRRTGRMLATAIGIAVAVALTASLGVFLSSSQSTMTARSLRAVAVDWQVEVRGGANPADVLTRVAGSPGVVAAQAVQLAPVAGFGARTETTPGDPRTQSSQATGAGVVLGLPSGYRATFPQQIRTLTGADTGVLIAQQTAANLHVRPGDPITIRRTGRSDVAVRIDGVVDLPLADTLFQKVGAPPQSQPTAPPDNVVLMSSQTLTRLLGTTPMTTQIHVHRAAPAATTPAAAYVEVTGAARNLEAQLAGAGVVGDNTAAALDAARGDAAYAQLLFLFLGLPGAVLAALLTAAVVAVGADRRRAEQSLMRTRGLSMRRLVGLAAMEAGAVSLVGGLVGIVVAGIASAVAFGPASLSVDPLITTVWVVIAFVVGMLISALVVLLPAARDARSTTVASHRRRLVGSDQSWWRRAGVDVLLLVAALVVFSASTRAGYSLVLAPEGVPSISVSYWAFLGPGLLWIGGALLLWRVLTLALRHGRAALTVMVAPLARRLSHPGASILTRQRRSLVTAMVLLALAVSFAISTSVFNATYQQQAEADAQLTNGADVTVTPAPGLIVHPGQAAAFATTPGVKAVEAIQHRYAYVGADLQDLYGVDPRTITHATALQDGYFPDSTAHQAIAALAARPDAVLVSSETVKDFQLSLGDRLNLRLQDASTGQLRTITFHYAGVVAEFPTAPKDSFFVANAAYVAQQTGSDAVGAFLVDTGGRDQARVAEQLRHQTGDQASVTDLTQVRGQIGTSLTSVDLAGLTRLELVFAIVLAVAAAGLVLAAGLAERRRTLAIMSLLGARPRQLRGLVLAEIGLVAVGGLVGGLLLGWGLSVMLIKVLTGVFDPPPSTIPVPVGYLAIGLTAVLVALTTTALTAARDATRAALPQLRDL